MLAVNNCYPMKDYVRNTCYVYIGLIKLSAANKYFNCITAIYTPLAYIKNQITHRSNN